MKWFCRGCAFVLTIWLTAILIKAPNTPWYFELPLYIALVFCAGYGWEKE